MIILSRLYFADDKFVNYKFLIYIKNWIFLIIHTTFVTVESRKIFEYLKYNLTKNARISAFVEMFVAL